MLLSMGGVSAGSAQNLDFDIEELRAWAEARAAEDRSDQIALRFGPLTERLRAQGRPGEAEELLRIWFRSSGGASPRAAQDLAQLLLESEQFEELVSIVQQHRAHSDSSALALEMALANWELGRLDEAEREFEVALETRGAVRTGGLASYQWARFLSWSGRLAESWAQYALLLEGPLGRSADIVLGAARSCTAALTVDACDPQRARELGERAVDLLPEHSGARYNLVRALEAVGARDEARTVAAEVRSLLAADQERTRALGLSKARAAEARTRLTAEGPDAAYGLLCDSADLKRCLSSGWRDEEEWLVLARVLWLRDDRDDAVSLLERLVATHPEHVEWRALLQGWRREVGRVSN